MSFTAQDVKNLREKTGCGMMDCKKALNASNGNMEAAIDFLREKGLAAATKKSGRIAAEGLAMAFTNEEGNLGVAIEVNAETDFVAKNAEFQAFVKTCADTIMKFNPKDVEELLKCQAVGSELTVADLLQEKILTIGENIKIRRFELLEGVVASYVHAGGKIGVLVKFDVADKSVVSGEAFKTFAKDIAMQVAAASPAYLKREEVPAEVLEHEKKILKEQIVQGGAPEKVADKILEGKIGKYYKEVCLVDQPFVKDGHMSVADYAKNVSKELGTEIKIDAFVRFEKGQGLEKKEDNFADEVAGMIK